MSTEASSPKRRHILSSINPGREKLEPPSASDDATPFIDEARNDEGDTDHTKPKRTRLKLKGEKRRHRSHDDRDRESSHRRHHRHSRRRHRSPTPPNPHDPPPLDPDAAFRESLFDAMADDEGAAYWEGVYGQPMHIYSAEKVGASGELERMTDEEYAAHVRQKMWEKTHAGLLEERERRQAERKRRKEEERQSRKRQEEMERSMRREEGRRRRRVWTDRWEEYIQAWSEWDSTPEKMAWPIVDGQRKDVNEQDVREFFICGLDLESLGEKEFAARLKDERVRWHPDKIQQKLGGKVDNDIIKDVTVIFQTVDRLWTQMRSKTKS